MTLYLNDILPRLTGQIFASQQNEWVVLNDVTPPSLLYSPILPGRDEAVKYDATPLVRGVDYTLNYLTGQVTRVPTSTVVADGDQCAFTYSYDALQTAFYEAVKDFARRSPREKAVELAVVAGTAAYALPDDWLFKVKINIQGTWELGQWIDPFTGNCWCETDFIIDNGNRTLTFTETPASEATLCITYAAGYPILTDDLMQDYFDGLNDSHYQVLLYKAWAIACASPGASFGRSGPPAGALTEYTAKIGNEQATKKWDATLTPQKMAMVFEQLYQDALKGINRPVALRSRPKVASDAFDIPSTLSRNW